MEPVNIVLWVIAGIAAITVIGMLMSRSARNKLYFSLLGSFGQIKKHDLSFEDFDNISHYFKNTRKDGEFFIDDITWNDLDLDRIFLMMDNTNSAIGRDSLYKLLRMPVNDEKELQKRDALIEYFNSHDFERTNIMMQYSKIGFPRRISISDYMNNLFKLKPQNNFFHFFIWILYAASVAEIFFSAILGIFMIIIAVAMSVISYYRTKSRIDSYFECVRQLIVMVKTADCIQKLDIEELKEYNEFFKVSTKTFGKITRNSYVVVAQKQGAGSLADIIMEYVKMFTHIDLIKFNSMLKHFDKNYEAVEELMAKLGYIEAMISIASFRRTLPYYCKPEFKLNRGLECNDMYHLLIKEPVPNSIKETRPMLITGSNASGKSTFLKSTAICSILAQTVFTCPAAFYNAPMYHVYSSMALSDDIDAGESYYMVEIKSLKRIVDESKKYGVGIMCFIDEVLRGTNTVERIAASSEILKNLAEAGTMCFAATHDVELTHILENYFANYHFSEQIVDDTISFSYELQKGRTTSRNAIRLLGIIGYDKKIIKSSENRANEFMDKGVWNKA